MDNVIIHNTSGLELFRAKDLKPLQNDYKRLSLEGFNKLKKSIDEHGFSFSNKVWIDNGIIWIIGGHQRQKVLLKSYKTCTVIDYVATDDGLVEASKTNYNEIMIPCEQVRAKNRREAIELLLLDDSRFGETNKDSKFFMDEDVSAIDFSLMSISGINIDLDSMNMDFMNDVDTKKDTENDSDNDDRLSEEELMVLSESNENTTETANLESSDEANRSMKIADNVKLKHGTRMISLSFKFPEKYFEEVEVGLSKVPIRTIGSPTEQEKRGKRLLRLLGITE